MVLPELGTPLTLMTSAYTVFERSASNRYIQPHAKQFVCRSPGGFDASLNEGALNQNVAILGGIR
jgi:hypothetical protein